MYTEITLDKPRRLRFDLSAIQELEAALGSVPLGLVRAQIRQLGMTAIALSLWVGLKHEDRALTRPLANRILETYLTGGGSLVEVTQAILDAFDASGLFGVPGGSEGNAPAEPATTSR